MNGEIWLLEDPLREGYKMNEFFSGNVKMGESGEQKLTFYHLMGATQKMFKTEETGDKE